MFVVDGRANVQDLVWQNVRFDAATVVPFGQHYGRRRWVVAVIDNVRRAVVFAHTKAYWPNDGIGQWRAAPDQDAVHLKRANGARDLWHPVHAAFAKMVPQ